MKHWFELRKGIGTLATIVDSNTELSFLSLRTHLTPLSWIAVLAASLAAWGFEQFYANPEFNTFYIRIAVCLIGLPLFITPYPRNEFFKKHQKMYLTLFLTLLFPIMFSWNGLANAAQANAQHSLSGAWLTEYALAVFLYLGLFSQPLISAAIAFLTLAATAGVALIFFGPVSEAFLGTGLFMSATIVTAYFFLKTTHQQLSYVLQHRIETAYSIGSRVAHELRTPLLSIRNYASNTKKIVAETSDEQSVDVDANLAHILREVEFANRTIDILLVSTRSAPFGFDPRETFQAEDVSRIASDSYPYANSSQKNSTKIDSSSINFQALGPQNLVVHALYNLMKNALLSATSVQKTLITIAYWPENSKGIITVTDNGPGIPERLQHKVFEDFYTTRAPGDGTGLGLSFCKSLMLQLGGKIDYQRQATKSVFKMTFPID